MMHETIYPHVPGFKGNADTGREAAEEMTPKCGRLQRMALERIRGAGTFGLTPEELAVALDVERVTIQPRTSELSRLGLIEDSGLRRRNASSGKRAIVWVACEQTPKAEAQ